MDGNMNGMGAGPVGPDQTETQASAVSGRRRGGRRRVLLAALLAICVAGAGSGFAVWRHGVRAAQAEAVQAEQTRQAAYDACAKAQSDAQTALEAYQNAVADSQQVAATDPSTLADSSTLDALNSARTSPAVSPDACRADLGADALDALTDSWKSAAAAWTQGAEDIQSAAQAVSDSQAAKARQDRVDALNGKIQEARALLDSSDGNVADAQTRFTLTDAINAAQGIVDDQSSAPDAFDQASSGLDAAMGAVNDSIARKQADDAAAAQAAAAAAQAQAQRQAAVSGSSTGRRQTTGTSRATTGTSGSTGRSTTSGGAASGSAPAPPASGNTGTSGGSSSSTYVPHGRVMHYGCGDTPEECIAKYGGTYDGTNPFID
ncbi:colicin transporter [Pseudoscardovia radai]|uniref:Colicin transporter n=1 Tax=Pseudoscardovia radai TaxID=987066 RepID=A0A261EUG0_9BIFI|nr:hypothetical protein [Pseudoscardovia radai]OZG50467.1 colicin transporter [Pseudoscardovia radai]